jgi:23S rRNA pseudouridine955/2504/2580 synthase|tara:strand:- start:17861 stop:18781 length:921 start_codon:yes stop_codon:yes gene_type:complete
MSVKNLTVDKDNAKRRLDNLLMSTYKELPRSKVYSMIRKGEVRVNSGRTKPLYKVKEGDIIRIPPYLNNENQPKRPISNKLQDRFKQRVLFEDLNYIVLNKPTGTPVHSGSGNTIGAIDILRSFYSETIDLCHRLDKETSGCLVFAKNKTALRFFNKNLALRDKDLKKTYIAILKGSFKKDLFIDNNINTIKSSTDHKVNIDSEEGKYASSLFRPIKKLKKSTLVEIDIYSGRTHQIRVQAESLNHNVANDIKYGDSDFNKFIALSGIKSMALHAKLIEFKDEENNLIKVEAPFEDSFAELIDYLN